MQLDHVTIRTQNLAATRAFFLEVFEHLEEGSRPRAIQRIPGHWLYAKDQPIVHIIGAYGQGFDGAPEAWDHIAFKLDGYDEFRARLNALKIPYSPMELPELGERRLFIRAPGGPVIETVFRENRENEGQVDG
ncbi:glyoxalase [Sulfitobacter sp.]|uniref:glyoxalase n=1 Tax=Sulfitobacter sp. TaxID=1903071 RepID=UPI003001CEC8